jgi:hypothetical protein
VFLVSVWFLRLEKSQGLPFMNGHMIGLVALDEVLWFILRGVVQITLEPYVRSDLPENDPANSSGLRVPRNVVTPFEHFGHMAFLPTG